MLIITSKKRSHFLSSIASNQAHNSADAAAVIKKGIVTLLDYSGARVVLASPLNHVCLFTG